MKRLFWLGVGIAVGAVVVRQLTRTAHAYSPSGLAESARNSAAGWWESVQDFVADVRDGMAEREEEIQAAFAQGVSLGDLDDAELNEEELYDELEYGSLDDNGDNGDTRDNGDNGDPGDHADKGDTGDRGDRADDRTSTGRGMTHRPTNDQGNGAGVRR